MGMDIIAENQTERTIQALMNGDADTKTQQAALAAVLRTTMAQARELEQIKQNLWKPDDLERAVEAQIRMKCRECPARRHAEEVKDKPANWFVALVTSESFRYFLLIVMFAWALRCAMWTASPWWSGTRPFILPCCCRCAARARKWFRSTSP